MMTDLLKDVGRKSDFDDGARAQNRTFSHVLAKLPSSRNESLGRCLQEVAGKLAVSPHRKKRVIFFH
jgi:hypothetical protein